LETEEQRRWNEIKFYLSCHDLVKLNNNLMDLMDFIDTVAIFGQYSPEELKPIAKEIIGSNYYRPGRGEFLVLAHKMNIPMKVARKRVGFANNKYYELIQQEKKDPRMFYPRLTEEKYRLVKQFLNALEQLKGVGI